MVVAAVGKVAEVVGEVVGEVIGEVVGEVDGEVVGGVVGPSVGLAFSNGLSAVSKVSLSPNVPSSPSKETKQEAGGSVPTDVAYLYVWNDVGLYDTPTDGGIVVVKTVKKILSVW